ncbi:MAG: hypothetical protein ABI831_13640 [Betaproteobacteria bacterium]
MVVTAVIVKRVYEAVYAKVLVNTGDLLMPQMQDMTPQTRALFQLMFGEQNSTGLEITGEGGLLFSDDTGVGAGEQSATRIPLTERCADSAAKRA